MIIEEVMAVDTEVGRAYRKATNERYEASPIFRNNLNVFWAIPALCMGAGVTAAVADNGCRELLPVVEVRLWQRAVVENAC